MALVSSAEASENVAETAVTRVARTAKTVVNFMIKNLNERLRAPVWEQGKREIYSSK